MTSFIEIAYRNLTCAAAALLITLVVGASFVQSTATTTGSPATVTQSVYERA